MRKRCSDFRGGRRASKWGVNMVHVYVASAFSKDNKGGNKAGVVLDRPELTSMQKMAIAKELGYSETAFVTTSKVADYKLEYFTPTDEVPLCGHATIATFSVLFLLGKLEKSEYFIETKAGILKMKVDEDGKVFMEQNRPAYYEILSVKDLERCVDTALIDTSMPIQSVSTGLKDILLPVTSVEMLNSAEFSMEGIRELSRKNDAVGIHAFAFVKDAEITAVCRNFAPLFGIDEESATGTASCALASYLFKHQKGKTQYIFEQGYSLGQPSRIVVTLSYEEDEIVEIFVGGYGYMVCEKDLDM